MHRNLAWDDLLYVLAVGRSGSLSGAARALKVNHSTVFRRIGHIEEQLGVRLFDRMRDGYAPTAAGEAMIVMAERMDAEVIALERRLHGEDLRPCGTLRVTSTDTLIPIVTPLCAKFRSLYPGISIDLITGNQMLNLSRRDADVALRPSREPPEDLHGRRLATLAFAAYGSHRFVEAGRGQPDWRPEWIGLEDSLSHLTTYKWMREHVPSERVVFRANSFVAMMNAAQIDMGLALLPCYMADPVAGLVRYGDIIPAVATDFWLLVHEDLRRTARVRAFLDFIAAEIVQLRPLLEGQCVEQQGIAGQGVEQQGIAGQGVEAPRAAAE